MTYIPTASYEPGFPAEWEGLDLASAEDATPRWYGVSSGNGNDGVSQMYPDYCVRTCDPWSLARLAAITAMNERYQDWASEVVEVDGEAEYTISATILDPPDAPCDDGSSWSDSNGAWHIVEVFPVDEPDERMIAYDDGLAATFGLDALAKYAEN
jgi:hypothetical protein